MTLEFDLLRPTSTSSVTYFDRSEQKRERAAGSSPLVKIKGIVKDPDYKIFSGRIFVNAKLLIYKYIQSVFWPVCLIC